MTSLLSLAVRHHMCKKYACDVPAALTPLSKIKTVTVVLDPDSPSFARSERLVKEYFAGLGKECRILTADFPTDWFGLPHKSIYVPIVSGDRRSLYINLCRKHSYAFRFLNYVTPAVVKAGIYPDDNYTITISGDDAYSCLCMILRILESIR